jgi:hypothetical protein
LIKTGEPKITHLETLCKKLCKNNLESNYFLCRLIVRNLIMNDSFIDICKPEIVDNLYITMLMKSVENIKLFDLILLSFFELMEALVPMPSHKLHCEKALAVFVKSLENNAETLCGLIASVSLNTWDLLYIGFIESESDSVVSILYNELQQIELESNECDKSVLPFAITWKTYFTSCAVPIYIAHMYVTLYNNDNDCKGRLHILTSIETRIHDKNPNISKKFERCFREVTKILSNLEIGNQPLFSNFSDNTLELAYFDWLNKIDEHKNILLTLNLIVSSEGEAGEVFDAHEPASLEDASKIFHIGMKRPFDEVTSPKSKLEEVDFSNPLIIEGILQSLELDSHKKTILVNKFCDEWSECI